LALASIFSVGSLVGFSGAFATTGTPVLRESGLTIEDAGGTAVAQAVETLLLFSTDDYTVRVFQRGNSGPLMNVFDDNRGILRINEQPATLREFRGPEGEFSVIDAYVSFGVFNERQVQYAAEVIEKPEDPAGGFARLWIVDSQSDIVLIEDAEVVSIFNVPPGVGQGQQENILVFDTSTYAVRVFRRGNERLMNVYNRRSDFTEVNGKLTELIDPPVAPYRDSVSYVASGVRNSQSVRYYARYNPSTAETILEIYDGNGQRVFREASVGDVTANIPDRELPPNVDPDEAARVDDAYVAAVFGDEETLREVQRLYPEAYFDDSARQGRFINAGAFTNEQEASIRVLQLQSEGFNARLVFRDVRYR
jgi:hypothetical protein